MQGRSYMIRGFGRTPPPPRAGKGPQNRFFFFSGIAQESVFVEKDERTPPTENKSWLLQDEAWLGSNGTLPKRRRRQKTQP